MWALVKDGSVDTVYGGVKAITLDDIKYPKEMFTLWTKSERKAIGVYDIVKKIPAGWDSAFHTAGTFSYTYNAGTDTVTETFDFTDQNLSDLKVDLKRGENSEARFRITGYDWLVIRYTWDNSKAIPDAVKTYTAAVRSHVNTTCTAIDNCSDLAALKVVCAKLADDGEYGKAWPDDSSFRVQYWRDF